jgi:hypothetical protein
MGSSQENCSHHSIAVPANTSGRSAARAAAITRSFLQQQTEQKLRTIVGF